MSMWASLIPRLFVKEPCLKFRSANSGLQVSFGANGSLADRDKLFAV